LEAFQDHSDSKQLFKNLKSHLSLLWCPALLLFWT